MYGYRLNPFFHTRNNSEAINDKKQYIQGLSSQHLEKCTYSVTDPVRSVMLIITDRMNYFRKGIRLNVCFSSLIITTVSKLLFPWTFSGFCCSEQHDACRCSWELSAGIAGL